MSNLERMARRLESDPFFLACPLKLYQQGEGLSEDALAARLGCSKETLVSIRLCRTPAGEAESFRRDLRQIVTRFPAADDALAEAVRRGLALFEMTRSGSRSRTLLAARDNAGEPDAGGQPEDRS
jgi:hypothetical protein